MQSRVAINSVNIYGLKNNELLFKPNQTLAEINEAQIFLNNKDSNSLRCLKNIHIFLDNLWLTRICYNFFRTLANIPIQKL